MADTKISQLTDGSPAQATDQIPVNRNGVNFRVNASTISAVTSVAGKTGAVTLVEGDITNLTTDLAAKAPLLNPVFTNNIAVTSVTILGSLSDTGLSRAGVGIVAVGNGTAADASGTLKVATIQAGSGSNTVPTYSFASGATFGWFLPSANRIGLAQGSAERFAIDLNGGGQRLLQPNGGVYGWVSNSFTDGQQADTAISRLAAASIAIGNGTTSDASGKATMAHVKVTALQVFANNAAAITGGLAAGDFYRTGADPDVVCVVH